MAAGFCLGISATLSLVSVTLLSTLKALANEDTLLQTKMFPRLPARATFIGDTNFASGTQKVFLILFRNILCPQQMFPSLRSLRNIMGNNVSSFTRAFRPSSDAMLHMSRKECKLQKLSVLPHSIRFGSCEVQRLNRALEDESVLKVMFVFQLDFRIGLLSTFLISRHHFMTPARLTIHDVVVEQLSAKHFITPTYLLPNMRIPPVEELIEQKSP